MNRLDPIISDIVLNSGQQFCLNIPGEYTFHDIPDWMQWDLQNRTLLGQAPYRPDGPVTYNMHLSQSGGDWGVATITRVCVTPNRDTSVYLGDIRFAEILLIPMICCPTRCESRQYSIDIHPGRYLVQCLNATIGNRVNGDRFLITTSVSKRLPFLLKCVDPRDVVSLIVQTE